MATLAAVATSTACKIAGGVWSGGHDLSGHTFLLTHASMFLWSEVAPTVAAGRRRGLGRGAWGVLALLGIWWWMLLMTGVYFHTWREKVSFGSFRVMVGHADCVVVDGLDRGDGGVGDSVSLGVEDAAGVDWRSGHLDLDGRKT